MNKAFRIKASSQIKGLTENSFMNHVSQPLSRTHLIELKQMSIFIIFLCHMASVDLEQFLGHFYYALLYFCLIKLSSQHHSCMKKSILRFTEKNTLKVISFEQHEGE